MYGDHDTMPADYVEKQRLVNTRHLDGRVENEGDDTSIWDIISLEDLGCPASVLSIGCRTGYELRQLRRALPDARLVGVDIVPEFIETAKQPRLYDGGASSLDFQVANMHNLPFEEREFELVLCIGTLEHAYNIHLAAWEMQRVCAKRLIVTADLADRLRGSDFACSSRPSEWIALFDMPEWRLIHAWTEPGCLVPLGIFMEWKRT
jgi:SAM-dependent methyltransferase